MSPQAPDLHLGMEFGVLDVSLEVQPAGQRGLAVR